MNDLENYAVVTSNGYLWDVDDVVVVPNARYVLGGPIMRSPDDAMDLAAEQGVAIGAPGAGTSSSDLQNSLVINTGLGVVLDPEGVKLTPNRDGLEDLSPDEIAALVDGGEPFSVPEGYDEFPDASDADDPAVQAILAADSSAEPADDISNQ